MLELRNLFALMIASTRKYLDPTRAVELLKGNIGTNKSSNGNGGNNALVSENIQQDVSEFTHIFLDWLEEAFKAQRDSAGGVGAPPTAAATAVDDAKDESMEQEEPGGAAITTEGTAGAQKDGEKEDSENVDPNRQNQRPVLPPDPSSVRDPASGLDTQQSSTNPITRLIYGKILTEGCLRGEDFSRTENFGQYPLQVNNFSDLHESIESSTARSTLVTSSSDSSSVQSDNRQEQWFSELPPVLFFSLSRFQFNTERGFAEKIHNRLEFSERIYMDRYMSVNKNITRSKREEVRQLNEEREGLKRKRQKFTHYGADGNSNSEEKSNSSTASTAADKGNNIPLQNILQYTMDFASGRDPSASSSSSSAATTTSSSSNVPSGQDFNMASPSSDAVLAAASSLGAAAAAASTVAASGVVSSLMQVDSPVHSPKMTPASSTSNLATAAASGGAGEGLKDEDTPMDVEEEVDEITSNETDKPGCDGPTGNVAAAANEVKCVTVAATRTEASAVGLEDKASADRPKPRGISEEELRVIMVC